MKFQDIPTRDFSGDIYNFQIEFPQENFDAIYEAFQNAEHLNQSSRRKRFELYNKIGAFSAIWSLASRFASGEIDSLRWGELLHKEIIDCIPMYMNRGLLEHNELRLNDEWRPEDENEFFESLVCDSSFVLNGRHYQSLIRYFLDNAPKRLGLEG